MPRGVFQMKAIKWRTLNVPSIEEAVYAELDREGDILIRQYKATTRTWEHQPVFWKAVGRSMYKAGVRMPMDKTQIRQRFRTDEVEVTWR